MGNNSWKEYAEKTKNSKPRPFLVEAVSFVQNKLDALDLGSGALNDVRYLISAGFKNIIALDIEPIAEDVLKELPPNSVDYVISNFEDFDFPLEKFDLVNAQYSLPFNPKDSFSRVFNSISNSLKIDGIFTGQLFGNRDEWNKDNSNINFFTKEETENLFSKFEILKFVEEEADKDTALEGQKHWHVFHFIVRKK